MAKYNDVDDTEVEEEKFRFMSTQIDAQHWMNLGGNLGISGVQLSQIQGNNPFNVMEQVFQMLLRWKQLNGRKATYTNLYTALHKSGLDGLKQELQDMRQETQKKESDSGSSGSNSPKIDGNAPNEAKKNIFISFSLKSLVAVTKLKDRIEKVIGKGSCWICTDEIRGGDILNKKIAKALDNADIVLCMINKDYINSTPCDEEVSVSKSKKKCIIPILLEQIDWGNLRTENGDPPAMQLSLHQLAFINMYDQAKDKDEFKKLIKAIEERSGKST